MKTKNSFLIKILPIGYLPPIALVPKLDDIDLISSNHQAALAKPNQFDPTSAALSLIVARQTLQAQIDSAAEDTKERRFACEKCSRRYVRKISLQRHQKYECGNTPHLTCPAQGYNLIITNITELKPIYKHWKNGEYRYFCPRCSAKYKHEGPVIYHLRECGVGAQCPYCPKVVTQRRNLAEHVKRAHFLRGNHKKSGQKSVVLCLD
uniref:CSON005666 protein n=1 Tax=Culicoides sonorensis TaxID=179676 RepID=A0A336N3C0_CULSO